MAADGAECGACGSRRSAARERDRGHARDPPGHHGHPGAADWKPAPCIRRSEGTCLCSGPPRSGARSGRGKPCRSPAVRERRRCRMHGGAAGGGNRSGPRSGNDRHGGLTCGAIEMGGWLRQVLRDAREVLSAGS
ncbi:MAG: HGGxSTG domain-containing protein [Microvirga sp.]